MFFRIKSQADVEFLRDKIVDYFLLHLDAPDCSVILGTLDIYDLDVVRGNTCDVEAQICEALGVLKFSDVFAFLYPSSTSPRVGLPCSILGCLDGIEYVEE